MRKKVLELKEEMKRNAIGCVLNMVVFLLCALLLVSLFWIPIKIGVFTTFCYMWMNPKKNTAFLVVVAFMVVSIWSVLYWASLYEGAWCFVRSFKFFIRYVKNKKAEEEAEKEAIKYYYKRLENQNNIWNFFLNGARIKSRGESIKK